MRRRSFGLGVVGLLALSVRAMGQTPTKAQPTLSTVPLTIVTHDGKSHVFTVEVASTPVEQETGLMFGHRFRRREECCSSGRVSAILRCG